MSTNRNQDISALILDLQDPNDNLRSSAADALGDLGAEAKDAIPALIVVVQQEQDYWVRNRAIVALGNMGEAAKDAIPALIEAFKADDAPNPPNAATALGKIGKAAIPNLVALLKDSDEKVHRIAAEALGEIGVEAITALIQAFEERSIRRDVVYALGRIKPTNQDVIDFLTKIANDESNDLDVRWMAAVGLDRNGVDMETFFVNHNLPSPYAESIKCLSENWDSPFDETRRKVVYAFDVYTGQCVLIGYVGGRFHSHPVDIYEEAVKMVQNFLGKN